MSQPGLEQRHALLIPLLDDVRCMFNVCAYLIAQVLICSNLQSSIRAMQQAAGQAAGVTLAHVTFEFERNVPRVARLFDRANKCSIVAQSGRTYPTYPQVWDICLIPTEAFFPPVSGYTL